MIEIDSGRQILADWEAIDNNEHSGFIHEARYRLSHDRWPKKQEDSTRFEFDYYTLPTTRWPMSSLLDRLNKCLLFRRRSLRLDVDPQSLIVTQAREQLETEIAEIRNTRDVPPRHPDSLRKWNDPKKTLYDGTPIWNSDGSPALPSLATQHNKFILHGDGGDSVHEWAAFRQAYRQYEQRMLKKVERERPPKNREKTPEEVAEYLALKEQQREASRKKRERLDAADRAQFQQALKERNKARQ